MMLVTCALSRHGSFLLVDQLSYVSACTIATARIEAEAGGAYRKECSFVLCAKTAKARGLCVSE